MRSDNRGSRPSSLLKKANWPPPEGGIDFSALTPTPEGVKFHDILYRSFSPHPLHFFEFDGVPDRAERGRECRRT